MNDSRLYLILDKATCASLDLKDLLEKAIKGGVDLVQYRDKASSTKEMIEESIPLLKTAQKARVPFIINDRLDVAVSINADGLHLGQEDMPVETARKILGKGKILGLSCHTLAEIKKAQKQDVDYLGFGPIFRTATKPESKPKGRLAYAQALKAAHKPVFAIGGVTKTNLNSLSRTAPLRIAVCREICLSKHPQKTAGELKNKIKNV